ncbi:F510_1955 family glycosylhydrolase [Streptosporangium sp. CA-135522]|uniref:F510_1955 family glycosylhydrolase n=1 Tax=Streptosporangium sp. CA-135522 TaxID=3240072 RepID=UPI003D91DFA9
MASIDQHLRLRTGAVLALLAFFGTACTEGPSEEAAGPADPGIGHVHGLGIDSSDGTVYIAGHYGLFQVGAAGTARRVADRIQDHMGFTVIGPKTFLASGHPAAADVPSGGSPHLGLIRTTDAGVTWTSVSEAGTADFHSIQPAGADLYAYDSQKGQVRRSADEGQTWVPGAKVEVIDLAGHKEEPNRVYATTPDGLQVSSDGGMNFTVIAGAPFLSHVDSPSKDELIGLDADGQVQASKDGGETWRASGRLPGQASAFTVVSRQRLLAAMEDGTVMESPDGGRTFSTIYRSASS